MGLAEGIDKGKAEGLAEGLAEGIGKGKAEGLAEGIVKGKAEGLAEGLAGVVINCNRNGFSLDQIQAATGLSKEKIREILRQI
jgi:flagellar biosynthesis/type III secretory pathway protein FliH